MSSSTYLYVYDQELGHPRYHKLLARLDTRILELGIKGRTVRLTPLKNLGEVVSDAVAQGAQTVVAVGGDSTLNSAISACLSTGVTVGFVPTDAGSSLARVLGIPPLDGAVEVLSARIVKTIDVGQINGGCFIDGAAVSEMEPCVVTFPGFRLETSRGSSLRIGNIGFINSPKSTTLYDPADGKLTLSVIPPKGRGQTTQLAVTAVTISSGDDSVRTLLLDGCVTQRMPAKVSVHRSAIKLIVGADRLFI